MNSTTKTFIVMTLAAGAVFALITNDGSSIGTTLGGGLLGDRAMGEYNWMWLPTLLWVWVPTLIMIGFGAFLVWVTFEHRQHRRKSH